MKISTPMISLDARGRLKQAVVFSIWRGLNYCRGYVTPTNPSTERQLVVRAFFTAASRAWGAVTSAQRTAWRDYSKLHLLTDVFGNSFAASGLNWYVGLFCRASDLGETPVSDPPATAAPVEVSTFETATGEAGEIDVSWVDNSDGDFVDIWITPELPDGREPRKGDYVHRAYVAQATAEYTITGLATAGRYSVMARALRANGQAGPPQIKPGLSGAAA